MPDFQLALNSDERQFLLDFLAYTLKDTAVEEHRTRTLSYREHLVQREQVIRDILQKLQATQA